MGARPGGKEVSQRRPSLLFQSMNGCLLSSPRMESKGVKDVGEVEISTTLQFESTVALLREGGRATVSEDRSEERGTWDRRDLSLDLAVSAFLLDADPTPLSSACTTGQWVSQP